MKPQHIIILLLAVVGYLPVSSPKEVKKSEKGKLMFLGIDGWLIHLIRSHPHAVSFLKELEVVLIQKEY